VTIQNWIDKGWLVAYRTAGGHRRVRREDLIAFLESRNMPHRLSEQTGGPPKVLLIGGEEEANHLIRDVLHGEDTPCDIQMAQEAFRAGLLYASEKPDVVILDLTFPGLDGVSVCRQIRQANRVESASVIAILGTGDTELRNRLLQAGAAHCVQKPIDTVALRELVHGAVRARKARPSPS
jgi:excisionase family DNA binding protein